MIWLETAARDLRFAARALRRSPTVTAAAVLTLALGVGVNTAIFSIVKSILLNQLPFRDPARLVALSQSDSTNTHGDGVGGWTVNEWRSRSRLLQSASVYGDGQLTLVENGEAEVLRGMRVSPDFFDTLGVTMQLGRAFVPEEAQAPRANVVILSYDLWSHRFGADPLVVGRVLQLNSEPHRVIGVLPETFRSLRMTNPGEIPTVFAPALYDPRVAARCHECFGGRVIARLKPGVVASQARAELGAIMAEIVRERPADYARDTFVRVEPLQDQLIGPVRTVLWVLLGAVGLVLLIACANVASLQLARASARAREFAVRAALGGGRARLATQLLIENLLLAALGGAAGVLLGSVGTSAIASMAPRELPRLEEVHIDAQVLLFALTVSVLVGLVFGMAPAWSASRADVNHTLKRTTGTLGRSSGGPLRNLLVVMDLALAFVLVVATGLLGRSFQNLKTIDAGFNPHNVLTMTPVMTPNAGYGAPGGRLGYLRRLVERVQSVPGVTAVGMVSNVPLSHAEPTKVRIDGQPPTSDAEAPTVDVFWASPDYFRALEIPLRRGRFLTAHDGVEDPPAVLISESFARSRIAGADPIGRRIQLGTQEAPGPWLIVAGIVGDVRYDRLDRDPRQAVYLPQALNPFHYTRLVARTSGDPWRFERAIRAAMRDAEPTIAIFHVQPMDDYVASSLAARSFALTLIALFGALALVLSAVGVYGLVSYSVVQRTPELGLRAALGATRGNLLALIAWHTIGLAGAGLGLGVLAGFGLMRLLASFLFGVGPSDVATLAAAASLLFAVAGLASYLPARSAARVDPLEALRAD